MKILNPIALVLASIVVSSFTSPAVAQSTYPERPIRFVVGYPPGQSVDMIARTFAAAMSKELGQNIVVDNKPGANGIVGAQEVKNAKPDGYTVLVGTSGQLTINPALYKKLPYDVQKDFVPVGLIGKAPVVLIANPLFPASNIKELIALAKSKPGKLDYASGGSGITAHLAMELFKDAAGIEVNHIPYKGSPAALNDVIGGQVPLMMESVVSAIPHIHAGKVKVLGVSSGKRYSALPDVPTIREQGIRDYEVSAWTAMMAPAGTPPEIVIKLTEALQKATLNASVQQLMNGAGVFELGSTSAELHAVIQAEIPRWTRAVQKSGAQVD